MYRLLPKGCFKEIEGLFTEVVKGMSHQESLTDKQYNELIERVLEILFVRNDEIHQVIAEHGFEKIYDELKRRFQHFKKEQVL